MTPGVDANVKATRTDAMTATDKMLPSSKANGEMVVEAAVDGDTSGFRRQLWRNVFVANIAYAFINTGIVPLTMLLTSLYEEDGLGAVSLSVIFGVTIPACFLTGPIVSKLGSRALMLFFPVGVIVFMLANLHPVTYVLLPASVVIGFAFSAGNVALRAYSAKLGQRYASLFSEDSDRIMGRVSTIFYIIYRGSVLVGNVVSSSILGLRRSSGDDNNASSTSSKEIFGRRMAAGIACGARYCNEDLTASLLGSSNRTTSLYDRPTDERLRAFLVLGIALSAVALLLLLFRVQTIRRLGMSESMTMGSWQLFTGVIRQHSDLRFLLLLPIMTTANANDHFWNADFTKGFVTCSIGIHNNGYVSVWSSVSSIACCCFFGWFNTKNSRIVSIALATAFQLATAIVMLHYEPDDSSFVMLCIFAATWYLGSGIRQSLIPALLAVVLSDNLSVSFSNFIMWGGIGGVIFFGLHNVLCTHTKIMIVIVFNAVAFVLYAIFEVWQRFCKKT